MLYQASRILLKLVEPIAVQEASSADEAAVSDEFSKPGSSDPISIIDYSKLFGEDFEVPDDKWDLSYLSILDVGAVEEGILHILFACASQVGLQTPKEAIARPIEILKSFIICFL